MITRVTQFFIDRYQLTIVLFLMLAVMGWASWASIPKAGDPAIPIPPYIVVAVYPGAQPADVEQLVVDPIEEAMGELDALDQIRSDVQDGVAVMRIEFQPEEDADDKYGEVVREINALRPDLPADLHSLDVRKVSASEVNIAQVAGSAVLPILTGFIVAAVSEEGGARPEIAYRLAFGAIALCLAAGLAVYLTAKDVKPRKS